MPGRWVFALLLAPALLSAAVTIDTGKGVLRLDDGGCVTALTVAGQELPAAGLPAIEVETEQGILRPVRLVREGNRLTATLPNEGLLRLDLTPGDGFVVVRLAELKVPGTVKRLQLLALPVPSTGKLATLMNAWSDERAAMALMSTSINVWGHYIAGQALHGDLPGCTHRFERVTEPVKQGTGAVRFTATSERDDARGWSSGRHNLAAPLDLRGMKALRAWVHGDGSGAVLKLQLRDAQNGARDDTVVLNFSGWKQVELGAPSYNTLRYDRVDSVNLYFNGLPAKRSVAVVVDQIEAIVGEGEQQRVVPLADFETADSSLWTAQALGTRLVAESVERHGIEPAGVGFIACPRAELNETIVRFERAAGLPSPHPGGVWGKVSPQAKRSYMLAIRMTEADTEAVIAFAKRAGLDTILIFQYLDSWPATTGHYLINRESWPRGLDSLKEACDKIHAAGLKVGLHYLGASIYPPDPYVAPVPDKRLVRDAFATLGADINPTATFIPTAAPPTGFPEKDVDYLGSGAVLRIGDELIHYSSLSMQPPYGFQGCARGYHGTVAAAHARGAEVAHMQRSYGYYLYDMDTPILDEVADNVTRIINACKLDMVYWDGSEQLQGDHWYYNAKLHKAFYDRMDNKDAICQGSSVSHYSWHIHSRLASADGHGDLKGYLDERAARFGWYRDNLLPIDVGWYSVFDQSQPLDAFEYIVAKAVGHDASISFGTMPALFTSHPYLMAIADRIGLYERVRLAGRVPEATKTALREPGRDYRLVRDGDEMAFQRVIYLPRHDVAFDGQANEWTFEVGDQPCRVAAELLTTPERWSGAGPAYLSEGAIPIESFESLKPYQGEADAAVDAAVMGEGKAGMVKEGVTQKVELLPGGPAGEHYVQYTATSTLDKGDGWSAFGRSLPILDLSASKGVGFWMKGDGGGGQFKLQLRDEVGAVDWYVANSFEGWRYVQLDRATGQVWRTLDWSKISRVVFYYNSLPAKATISCGLDGIKALPALDEPVLVNPTLEIDGQKVTWPLTLRGANRVFWWPGEPTLITGPGRESRLESPAGPLLQPGRHTAKFTSAGPAATSVAVKLLLLPPEKLPGGKAP
ncbi:MAG: hypothetical protein HUU35_01695 [Armatimonadetes bacterium]|nr:hypothetical protein [Armatimonadota bacterium]